MEIGNTPFNEQWRETMELHTKEELINYLKIVCDELHKLKKDKYFVTGSKN